MHKNSQDRKQKSILFSFIQISYFLWQNEFYCCIEHRKTFSIKFELKLNQIQKFLTWCGGYRPHVTQNITWRKSKQGENGDTGKKCSDDSILVFYNTSTKHTFKQENGKSNKVEIWKISLDMKKMHLFNVLPFIDLSMRD